MTGDQNVSRDWSRDINVHRDWSQDLNISCDWSQDINVRNWNLKTFRLQQKDILLLSLSVL